VRGVQDVQQVPQQDQAHLVHHHGGLQLAEKVKDAVQADLKTKNACCGDALQCMKLLIHRWHIADAWVADKLQVSQTVAFLNKKTALSNKQQMSFVLLGAQSFTPLLASGPAQYMWLARIGAWSSALQLKSHCQTEMLSLCPPRTGPCQLYAKKLSKTSIAGLQLNAVAVVIVLDVLLEMNCLLARKHCKIAILAIYG
jgi:hypothetical protein